MAGCRTRWTTIRGKSSASIRRTAIRHPSRVWGKRTAIMSSSGILPTIAINGALPRDVGTGFAEVKEWEFEATFHPVIPAWFGRLFADAGWAPTPLLVFLLKSGLLKILKVREATVSFGRQTEVWLLDGRHEACSVIGVFTQVSVADGTTDKEAGHRPGGARFPGS